MYTIHQSHSFIIDVMDTGEKNKFFWLFTRDFGLIHATAQSVRSVSSKLNPHLQIYNIAIVEFVRGKDVWRITNALDSEYNTPFTKLNKKSQEMYAKIALLLRRLYVGEESHPELFDALVEGFQKISKTFDQKTLEAVYIILVVKILYYLGYWESNKEYYPFHASSLSPEIIEKTLHKKNDLEERIKQSLRESHL